MTISDFALFADENIHEGVVLFLLQEGFRVTSVKRKGAFGSSDLDILKQAHSENQIVITQDGDFGRYVFTQDIPFIGIIFLRPGHFEPKFHITTLRAIIDAGLELKPPFIIVAENNTKDIRIRLRQI